MFWRNKEEMVPKSELDKAVSRIIQLEADGNKLSRNLQDLLAGNNPGWRDRCLKAEEQVSSLLDEKVVLFNRVNYFKAQLIDLTQVKERKKPGRKPKLK